MKINRNSFVFNIVFAVSLLLNFVNLKLYENTIIRIEIIITFYIIGIIFFLIFKLKLKEISPWDNFNNLIFCVLVIGSYLSTLILGTNYVFANEQTENTTYNIIRKTEIIGTKYNRSKTTPAVIIETENNYTKRIEFSRNLKEKMNNSKLIELELSNGFLNFKIIRHKELK